MSEKRRLDCIRGPLCSAMVFVSICILAGCAERHWAVWNLERFERAFDDSLLVLTTELPPAMVGEEYDFTLQAEGRPTPFSWRLVSGELPSGMKFGSDGEIRGIPTASEVARFVVKVACTSQPQYTAFGSSPHIGWRMRRFTLVVKDRESSTSARPNKSGTAVRP